MKGRVTVQNDRRQDVARPSANKQCWGLCCCYRCPACGMTTEQLMRCAAASSPATRAAQGQCTNTQSTAKTVAGEQWEIFRRETGSTAECAADGVPKICVYNFNSTAVVKKIYNRGRQEIGYLVQRLHVQGSKGLRQVAGRQLTAAADENVDDHGCNDS